jgi:hypothetical protein
MSGRTDVTLRSLRYAPLIQRPYPLVPSARSDARCTVSSCVAVPIRPPPLRLTAAGPLQRHFLNPAASSAPHSPPAQSSLPRPARRDRLRRTGEPLTTDAPASRRERRDLCDTMLAGELPVPLSHNEVHSPSSPSAPAWRHSSKQSPCCKSVSSVSDVSS